LTVGYASWLIFKQVSRYIQSSRLKRNAVVVSMRYFEVLRPKGALWQLLGFVLIAGLWALASFTTVLQHFLQ